MSKRLFFSLCTLLFALIVHAQNATFITLDDKGKLHKVNITKCTDTLLTFCSNFAGKAYSIALDADTLYINDDKGNLYKNILGPNGTTGTCTKVGSFINTANIIEGLTVGSNRIIYAANGSQIQTYNLKTKKFAILGSIPSAYTVGGDLLFYQGVLYLATKQNSLIIIDTITPSKSKLFCTFNATKVYGFASVTVPCSNNQPYALSVNGNNTDIFAINMTTKKDSSVASCTLNYTVWDAASVAETESATPPPPPTVVSPVHYCKGVVPSALQAQVTDPLNKLIWLAPITQIQITPAPIPSTASLTNGITYFACAFDTATKCYSDTIPIIVTVTDTPATPKITHSGIDTICAGSTLVLNSDALSANTNQWYIGSTSLSGANGLTYSATDSGHYTIKTTTPAGCSRTSTPSVVGITKATISYSGTQPFCPTGILNVNFSGDKGGKFTASPAGLSIDSLTGTINLGNSSTNNYIVKYTVGPAKCDYTTTVNVASSITASIKYPAPSIYCNTDIDKPVTLTVTPSSSPAGTFSAPSGLTLATDGTIKPSTSTPGTYTITYNYGTAGVGCGLQSTTATVKIIAATSSSLSGDFCTGGGSYTYNGTVYTTAGIYTIHLTNIQGCDSVVTLTVKAKNPTTGSASGSFCTGGSYVYNGITYTLPGTFAIHLTNAVGCDSLVTLTIIENKPTTNTINGFICLGKSFTYNGTTYSTAGDHIIKFTNAAGCDSIVTLHIMVDPFKIDSLATTPYNSSTNPINSGLPITVQIIHDGYLGSSIWEPSNLYSSTDSIQSINAPDTSFRVRIQATSKNGCIDTLSRLIFVNPDNIVYIPNALAPSASNAEAKVIKVYGSTIKTAMMKIFNQWGQVIFESNSPTTNGWDGTSSGKAQPMGVYIYTVKITFLNNKTETKTGSINLIR